MAAVLTLSMASPPALCLGTDQKQPSRESQSGTASAGQCCSVLDTVNIDIAWFVVLKGHAANCLEVDAVVARQIVKVTAGVETHKLTSCLWRTGLQRERSAQRAAHSDKSALAAGLAWSEGHAD